MLYFDLVKNTLIVAMASSIIITALVQKIKGSLNNSKFIPLISFICSMVVAPLFSLCFSNLSFINSLWVGVFTFAEADALYQLFENKIFKSFSNMHNSICISKDNLIGEKDE